MIFSDKLCGKQGLPRPKIKWNRKLGKQMEGRWDKLRKWHPNEGGDNGKPNERGDNGQLREEGKC
jgi:hypothetical protein